MKPLSKSPKMVSPTAMTVSPPSSHESSTLALDRKGELTLIDGSNHIENNYSVVKIKRQNQMDDQDEDTNDRFFMSRKASILSVDSKYNIKMGVEGVRMAIFSMHDSDDQIAHN